jgi:transposase
VETAEEHRNVWITPVRETGSDHLRHALSAVVKWKPDILAFVRFLPTRLSHRFVEGTNNLTKALMRQSSGSRHVLNRR